MFGEGVVNDATSVVLFNAIQTLDVNRLDGWAVARVLRDFLYLFSTSTVLGVGVSFYYLYVLLCTFEQSNSVGYSLLRLLCVRFRIANLILADCFHFSLQVGLLTSLILRVLYFGR